MPYDDKLAARIREVLADRADVEEKKMFGGLCFMVNGSMCCGLIGTDLMVRVGPDQHDQALARPHTRPMDFTGKPSKGMVYVAAEGLRTKAALQQWVARGIAFVMSKAPAAPRKARRPAAKREPGSAR
jgi:TfoX/Sxy family transcriptional regulator of competence genes